MTSQARRSADDDYFPPPEEDGGWRVGDPKALGVDAEKPEKAINDLIEE